MKTIGLMVISILLTSQLHAAEPHLTKAPLPEAKVSESHADKININSADVGELTHSFKGIGKKRAEAIVQYRNTHGAFKALEDLASVHGFGKKFVSKHLAELQTVYRLN